MRPVHRKKVPNTWKACEIPNLVWPRVADYGLKPVLGRDQCSAAHDEFRFYFNDFK